MKRNKKKLKKIITNIVLCTICWRNVDKHDDIWIYAKYDLLGGIMEGFNCTNQLFNKSVTTASLSRVLYNK